MCVSEMWKFQTHSTPCAKPAGQHSQSLLKRAFHDRQPWGVLQEEVLTETSKPMKSQIKNKQGTVKWHTPKAVSTAVLLE